MMEEKQKKMLYAWKICIDRPFFHCKHIYPIQQERVCKLLDVAQNDKNIQKIIIFGSSVTPRCHIASDLDVYIEIQNESDLKQIRKLPFELDLWTNFSVDERLYQEITHTGITVYQKEKSD